MNATSSSIKEQVPELEATVPYTLLIPSPSLISSPIVETKLVKGKYTLSKRVNKLDRFLCYLTEWNKTEWKGKPSRYRHYHNNELIFNIKRKDLLAMQSAGLIKVTREVCPYGKETYVELTTVVPSEVIDANREHVDDAKKRLHKEIRVPLSKKNPKGVHYKMYSNQEILNSILPMMESLGIVKCSKVHPMTGRAYTDFTQCKRAERRILFPQVAEWTELDASSSHIVLIANMLETTLPGNSFTKFVYSHFQAGTGDSIYLKFKNCMNSVAFGKDEPDYDQMSVSEIKDLIKSPMYSVLYGGNFKYFRGFDDVAAHVAKINSTKDDSVCHGYDLLGAPYLPRINFCMMVSRLEADIMFLIYKELKAANIEFLPCHDSIWVRPETANKANDIANTVIKSLGLKYYQLKIKE